MTTLSTLCAYQDQLTREVLESLEDEQKLNLHHEQMRRESQVEVISAFDAAFNKIFGGSNG